MRDMQGHSISKPGLITLYRMKTLRSALKLEILGMKRKGRSVYSIIKEEFGLTGSKQVVLEKFVEVIAELEQETIR